MTINERRAYSKGYCTAAKKSWSAWKPPAPPDVRVAALFAAARTLRDAASVILGSLDGDDEFSNALQPGVDAIDDEMEKWTEWLTDPAVDVATTC